MTQIALVALLALLPVAAHAKDFKLFGRELSLSGTNTFNYTYFLDNDGLRPDQNLSAQDRVSEKKGADDDLYHRVLNTLDISLSTGDVRLGARFDIYAYFDDPLEQRCGEVDPPQWCVRDRNARYVNSYGIYRKQLILPERLFLTIAKPEFDLTLGDFYASFGKGIALHVVKLDELGQDMTIRGGKFVLHQGNLGLTVLAGEFNPLDTDEATGKVGEPNFPRRYPQPIVAPWTPEPVVGGRLEYRFFDAVLVGVHSVWVITDDPQRSKSYSGTDYNLVTGVGFEIPSLFDGRLALTSEIDVQRTVSGSTADSFKGIASYSTATLSLGDWTLTAEVKHYDDFVLRAPQGPNEPYALYYHVPPTLERINAEVTDNINATGAHLRVDYNLGQRGPVELLPYVSYAFFRTQPESGRAHHEVHDPYAGLELTWQDGEGHLNLSAGVRYERDLDSTDPGASLYRMDIHVEGDIEQALAGTHSVKASWQYRKRWRRLFIGLTRWSELDTSLEYKWSPHLGASFTVEYTSDLAVVDDARFFFGGTLRYFFDSGTYVGIRAGETRPGLKCLQGLCRQYPPFAGVRAEAVVRF